MPHAKITTSTELIIYLFAEAGQCGNQIGAKFWEVRTVSRQRGLPQRSIALTDRECSYATRFEHCCDARTFCTSEYVCQPVCQFLGIS